MYIYTILDYSILIQSLELRCLAVALLVCVGAGHAGGNAVFSGDVILCGVLFYVELHAFHLVVM